MKRKTRKPVSIAVSVIVGLGCAIVITLLLSSLAAWLITTEKLGVGTQGITALVITGLSGLAGCIVALALAEGRELQVSGITAGAYFLLLLSCTALLFGGTYDGVWKSVITILISWLVSLLPVWRRKGNGSVKRRRKGYR
jgi:hypothetical protein